MFYKVAALVVFVLVYAFLAISKKYRARALWVGVFALALLGTYAVDERATLLQQIWLTAQSVFHLINWNVMGIFAGVLLVAEFFILTKVPVLLSDILVDRSRTVGEAMLLVCALTSVVSIFVENVAAVLIIAPLAMQISGRLKISPVPFLIGIAIASNLQGTATLVGDPPSMILADNMNLTFNDFFIYRGKPGIFFAVQVGAVFSFFVLWFFYRKFTQPTVFVEREKVTSWVPTVLLVAMIAVLAIVPVLENSNIHVPAGLVCMLFGLVALLWAWRRERSDAWKVVRDYDYRTVAFLMGVFALVGTLGLPQVGLIDDIREIITGLVGHNRLLAFTVIVAFSVALSAFIDNVPYLTAMLPVVRGMSGEGDPLLAFGLLIGACLGGNITPIGASANVVAIGLLRREGRLVSFWEFAKIGLPFTIFATVSASIFLWLIWG